MTTLIVLTFVAAYTAIALEHPIRINKAASALVGAGVLWTIYAVMGHDLALLDRQLDSSLAETAQIVFFLIGAMTIVEVIDAHNGFEVITPLVRTKKQVTLLWTLSFVTFFLSAILDNLTTTIVMIALVRKLLDRQADRLITAAMIVIAANAGGAWSPMGDVTTTMLWIGGQISPPAVVADVFLPALINVMVPLLALSVLLRGEVVVAPVAQMESGRVRPFERNLMFFVGLALLAGVPAFKTATHLPPFMAILFGLGLLWIVGEVIHRGKQDDEKQGLTLASALKRIDMSSIVFFVGILLSVAVLEHTHILASLAQALTRTIGRIDIIVVLLGLLSAIIDNVPLVAATISMYPLDQFPPDSFLWLFIAYCAGTGGSILIIGSAAGVAAMGLETITFGWYLKRMSGLALLGYLAGAAAYIVQYRLLH